MLRWDWASSSFKAVPGIAGLGYHITIMPDTHMPWIVDGCGQLRGWTASKNNLFGPAGNSGYYDIAAANGTGVAIGGGGVEEVDPARLWPPPQQHRCCSHVHPPRCAASHVAPAPMLCTPDHFHDGVTNCSLLGVRHFVQPCDLPRGHRQPPLRPAGGGGPRRRAAARHPGSLGRGGAGQRPGAGGDVKRPRRHGSTERLVSAAATAAGLQLCAAWALCSFGWSSHC